MTDIVERLRSLRYEVDGGASVRHEAADEIERLRAALLEISEHMSSDWTGDVMRKIARAALDGKND